MSYCLGQFDDMPTASVDSHEAPSAGDAQFFGTCSVLSFGFHIRDMTGSRRYPSIPDLPVQQLSNASSCTLSNRRDGTL
jgi:hypothetical protein